MRVLGELIKRFANPSEQVPVHLREAAPRVEAGFLGGDARSCLGLIANCLNPSNQTAAEKTKVEGD